jgi:hypothetical protein
LFQHGPRGDLLTPVPFRGLKLSRARSPCCSRVLHGMGARDARFVSKRASRRPSHACTLPRAEVIPSQESVPLEGSPCFARDRAIKCSTVEAAVLRRGRACLGVAAARARVVGGVGRRMRPPATVPASLHRDDGPSAVMWPPRSWWGPPVSGKKRFPAVNARGTSAPESSPAAYKSEGRGERRFFTLALRHFSPLCFRLRFALAIVRLLH